MQHQSTTVPPSDVPDELLVQYWLRKKVEVTSWVINPTSWGCVNPLRFPRCVFSHFSDVTCPYLRSSVSGPGGRCPEGKGRKIAKSPRTWTHPAPASTGYDSFCLAPSLGSKFHFLSGSPSELGEAGGMAEISCGWDCRCLKENIKFLYVLVSHEVWELACSEVGIFSCGRDDTQHDPGGERRSEETQFATVMVWLLASSS